MKGIVTRVDDPEAEKNNNRKRIQVCIPSYHGDLIEVNGEKKIDSAKTGTGSDLGVYPWAQVCSNMFNGGSSNKTDSVNKQLGLISVMLSLLFGKSSSTDNSSSDIKSIDMLYPSIGDYVWLMFEGGDIRCPVYMGALSPDVTNQVNVINPGTEYTQSGSSLGTIAYQMISSINNTTYNTLQFNSSNTGFGLLRWKGSNAKQLFINIKNVSPKTFTDTLSNSSADKFESDLNSSVSWANYRVQSGSNIATAVSSILGGTIGIQQQNVLALSDMNVILGKCKNITDQAAQLFFCHTYFNGFEEIATYSANKCDGTLDSIYNIAMTRFASYSATTKSYRKQAYDYINNLILSGKITAQTKQQSTGTDITTPTTPTPTTPTGGSNTTRPKNFKQFSSPWGSKMFGPGSYTKSRTYQSAGCSVTSMADILYTWFDKTITPETVGNKAVSWGYRTATSNGVGDAGAFYKKCYTSGRSLGWNFSKVSIRVSFETAYNAVKNGNGNALAILGINGQWSNGGHFVVMYKVDGDTIYINDPGINSSCTNGIKREKSTKSLVKAATSGKCICVFYKN